MVFGVGVGWGGVWVVWGLGWGGGMAVGFELGWGSGLGCGLGLGWGSGIGFGLGWGVGLEDHWEGVIKTPQGHPPPQHHATHHTSHLTTAPPHHTHTTHTTSHSLPPLHPNYSLSPPITQLRFLDMFTTFDSSEVPWHM